MARNDDWLAQVREDPIDPALPICDPHHHLWADRENQVQPRYLFDDVLQDVRSGHNVVSTVFVECRAMYRADGPREMRVVGEAEFVNGVAAMAASGLYGETRIAAGIVGYAHLPIGSKVKGVLEALVQCGAFDSVLEPMGVNRARAFEAIDRALERARSATRDRERGQSSMFALCDQAAKTAPAAGGKQASSGEGYPQVEAWDRLEMLRREKAALGCYVSGHPLFRYGNKLTRLGATTSVKLKELEAWSVASVTGMVENYQERLFKGGLHALRQLRFDGRIEIGRPVSNGNRLRQAEKVAG